MRVVDKKGVYCSLVLLAFIAFFFWTQSRLPALDEKAQMGQRNSISSLAFDVVFPLSADQSHVERIFNSSVNWAYTNWQGMSFGFLLAAAVLTLFSYLSFQRNPPFRSSRFKQAAIGMLTGTPLGVCANCSTPIAFGLYRGGLPVPTALAMLSSSPSFNIIVVMMSLSLLPLELVLIKSAMVLIFVLLFIPILSALFPISFAKIEPTNVFCEIPDHQNWPNFLRKFVENYVKKLFFVLKGTLPLMLLAGLLAATISEFVSLESLNGEWTYLLLFCVAFCAAFFPVPIAFDVVISVALLAAGVDIAYVAAMFFALGVFSIYPAMMIARDFSFRLSIALFLSVVCLAVLAGVLSSAYSEQSQQSRLIAAEEGISQFVTKGSAVENNLLPTHLARSMVRSAARACHALGETKQYVCFERFVETILSKQFTEESCVYLEDAFKYEDICRSSFAYLQASNKAAVSTDIEVCDRLTDAGTQRCRYNYYFEQSVEQLSLKPCLSLNNSDALNTCLSSSLSLNVEMYPNRDICQSLQGTSYFNMCLKGGERVRRDLALTQQGNLNLCLKNDNETEIRNCQLMLINHKLERGAEKSICREPKDSQLQNACEEFYQYFRSIANKNEKGCYQIKQGGLQLRCIEDAIHARLSAMLSDIQHVFLTELNTDLENDQQPDVGNSLLSSNQVFESLVLDEEVSITSDQGRAFVIKTFLLNSQSSGLNQSIEDKQFKQISAKQVGLDSAPVMQATELFEPFSYGRGIATADINSDLWPDLAIAYADNLLVYLNHRGTFIKHAALKFGKGLSPMLVSFVDVDGDTQKDLFVSFYAGENRIYWNHEGSFNETRYQSLKLENSQLVMSAAFQDIDQDGDIDMALGGWFAGDLRHFNPYRSSNYYIENLPATGKQLDKNIRREFKAHSLPGVDGETLSILFSDIDNDGKAELLVGNDMDAPDIVYQWRAGHFELANLNESLPSHSSFNTMSIASGDLNRDSIIDYFSVDMSFSGESGKDYCDQPGIGSREQCMELLSLDRAVKAGMVGFCDTISGVRKRECFEAQIVQLAKQAGQSDYCETLISQDGQAELGALCFAASKKIPPKPEFNYSRYQKGLQRNVLSLSSLNTLTEGALWKESAEEWGVTESHWSWHSKIADLNNDGWKDIYIGNGYMFGDTGRHVKSNVLFVNEQGRRMRQAEVDFGLTDYLNTPAFVTVDFDRDGDLDIISHRVAADHGVFINSVQSPGLSIELRDANMSVLGVSVTLEDSREDRVYKPQASNVALGGGFLSFDEPVMHFGMQEQSELDQLLISWPDGRSERLKFSFEAGHYYQVSAAK